MRFDNLLIETHIIIKVEIYIYSMVLIKALEMHINIYLSSYASVVNATKVDRANGDDHSHI